MRVAYYFILILTITTSCYTPERRVDFELQYSETRDQATEQEEIAPGLKAIFMHGFQTRTYVLFEFVGRARLKEMSVVATLMRSDGTTYTEEFETTAMTLKLAFVDDERHVRWMQDDLVSLELGGQSYTLYDKESTKRVLRQLYMASENKKL